MTRTVFALCLILQLAGCSTVSDAVSGVSSHFDRHYRIREENSEAVIIEYEPDRFSDAAMLDKANGTCNAYGKSAVFNKTNLEGTGHRVTVYHCLTQAERREYDQAKKAGDPLPIRRPSIGSP